MSRGYTGGARRHPLAATLLRTLVLLCAVLIPIGCATQATNQPAVASATTQAAAEPAGNTMQLFLGDWQVIGPFPADSEALNALGTDFLGNEAAAVPSSQPVTRGEQEYRWQQAPGRVLNFGAIFSPDVDQDRVVAYAYTTINVTEETKAVLAMGADDAVRAYLNGEKVYEFARPYGSYLDNHTANVTLKQGENRLLLKVFDAVQDWGAFARFTPDVPSPLQLNFKYPFNEKLGIYELPPVLIRFADAAGTITEEHWISGFRPKWALNPVYRLTIPTPVTPPAKVLARIDDSENEYTWDEVLNGTAVLGKPSTRTISGEVLDRLTGSPVANAKLSVGAEGPTAVSAEDGTFTIAGIDPSQVRLSARADGYQETIRQAMRSDSGPVEVHLDRGELTVRGRITDDKGAPIAGAVIKIENDGSSATTDADGRYTLAGLSKNSGYERDGKLNVYPQLTHPDYAAPPYAMLSVDLAKKEGEADFTMVPGGCVVGRVTAKEDGRPLAGVSIQTGQDAFPSNAVIPQTKTDQDGRYRLTGVRPGPAPIFAFHDDWAPELIRVEAAVGKEAPADFALLPGQTVSGKVVDREGKPVSGVGFSTDTWRGLRMFLRRGTTAADGTFTLTHMPADEVATDFYAQGYSASRDVKLTGGQTDVVVTMGGPAKIAGRVLDAQTREPIKQFQLIRGLKFHGNERIYWQNSEAKTITSPEGRFEEQENELANYDLLLRVGAPGYGTGEIPDLLIKQGDVKTDLEFLLTKGVMLTGLVTDPQGNALPGAKVQLFNAEAALWLSNRWSNRNEGPSAVTAVDGTFSISGGTQGEWGAYISKEKLGGVLIQNVKIGGDAPPLNVALQPFGSVEGYITLGGKAEKNTSIVVMNGKRMPHESMQISMHGKSDPDGYFRIDDIPAGDFKVGHYIEAESGGGYSRTTEVTIQPGAVAFVALGGEGTARLYGTARADGNPVANLPISLYSQSGGSRQFGALSRADGSYEIPDLPPGSYQLSANRWSRDGGSSINFSDRVDVAEGEQKEFAIVIEKQRPFEVGASLPPIVGKKPDGEAWAMPAASSGRVMAMFYAPSEDSTKKNLDLLVGARERLQQAGVPILLITSSMVSKDKMKEELTPLGLENDVVTIPSSWFQKTYRKIQLGNEMPLFLMDANFTIVAVCRDAAAIDSAIQKKEQ